MEKCQLTTSAGSDVKAPKTTLTLLDVIGAKMLLEQG